MLFIHILDHLRVICDLMSLFFIFDDYTDIASKSEVSKIADDIMNTFRYKKASESHNKISTMARE